MALVRARRRKRRKVSRRRNAWWDDRNGHIAAAKKGWRKKKRKSSASPKSRKRKSASRKRRKNPKMLSYMPNPRRRTRARRRNAGYRRRNPSYRRRRNASRRRGLQGLIPSQAMLRQSVQIGSGIAGGFVATPIAHQILNMAGMGQYDNLLGLVHVLLGSLMVGFVKNRSIKNVGMMITGFGVYDLVASNLKKAEGGYWLPPLPRTIGLSELMFKEGDLATVPPESTSGSYGVAMRPVSPVARAGVGSSYESPSMSSVGVAGDMIEAMGHLPGIDFD